jgi:galactose mutarotase-like enzyme
MITIENEFLKAKIKSRGAELASLYNKETGIEYLWSGDPKFWSRHSPVLFPIVGALKSEGYFYNNEVYQLEKHGFARDAEFRVESVSNSRATFSLSDNTSTRSKYPFEFTLKIHYILLGNRLEVGYEVTNSGNEALLFSIGAHPAFAVPLIEGTNYEDYYLEFEKEETAGIWPIEGNLIGGAAVPFLNNRKSIPLRHELFYDVLPLIFRDSRT